MYHECWEYLKESKIFLIVIALLFVVTLVAGYGNPIFFVDQIRELLQKLSDETHGMNYPQIFIFIFQNNLKTSFLGIILGIFLGIIPLFYSIINGYILGFVSSKASQIFGNSILLRLLPHGIFELPALIISLALGLRLGTFYFTVKNKTTGFLTYFVVAFSTLFILITSLSVTLVAGSLIVPGITLESMLGNEYIRIFLIPLFLVSFLLSLFIGSVLLTKNDRIRVKKNFKRDLEYALKIFLFVVLPLLFIAALIESGLIIFFE